MTSSPGCAIAADRWLRLVESLSIIKSDTAESMGIVIEFWLSEPTASRSHFGSRYSSPGKKPGDCHSFIHAGFRPMDFSTSITRSG